MGQSKIPVSLKGFKEKELEESQQDLSVRGLGLLDDLTVIFTNRDTLFMEQAQMIVHFHSRLGTVLLYVDSLHNWVLARHCTAGT